MAKILLVDDEAPIVHSTRLMLQHFGHEVVTAMHADDIVPLMWQERPDVLIQDVRMPGLDIRRLIAEVRGDAALRGTRILLFSASLNLEGLVRDTGVDEMVEKPFRPDELRDAVGRMLGSAAGA